MNCDQQPYILKKSRLTGLPMPVSLKSASKPRQDAPGRARKLPSRCTSCRSYECEVMPDTPCEECFYDPAHPMWEKRSRAQRARDKRPAPA